MEYTLLILLLLIMIWINLRNKISKSQEKTEELSKEIAALRRRLENSSEVADEIKEPEPETLKEPEVFVQPEPVKAIVEPARNLQPQKVRKPVNYEKYIGENLFGKIGILILVLGMRQHGVRRYTQMIDKKKLKDVMKKQDLKQEEPTDPSMTLDVKNEDVEAQIDLYLKEKTGENLNALIELMRTRRVLVPANLNDEKKPVPCPQFEQYI